MIWDLETQVAYTECTKRRVEGQQLIEGKLTNKKKLKTTELLEFWKIKAIVISVKAESSKQADDVSFEE